VLDQYCTDTSVVPLWIISAKDVTLSFCLSVCEQLRVELYIADLHEIIPDNVSLDKEVPITFHQSSVSRSGSWIFFILQHCTIGRFSLSKFGLGRDLHTLSSALVLYVVLLCIITFIVFSVVAM